MHFATFLVYNCPIRLICPIRSIRGLCFGAMVLLSPTIITNHVQGMDATLCHCVIERLAPLPRLPYNVDDYGENSVVIQKAMWQVVIKLFHLFAVACHLKTVD